VPAEGRFGFNAPRGQPLEATLRWAAANRFFYVDFNADAAPNGPGDFDAPRTRAIRTLCEQHGLHIGIHTSSAVNTAELAPFVADAVDEYNRVNIRLARQLGCEWAIVHGGYHFGDVERRREAAVARLQRLVEYAAGEQLPLWLENHNKEPDTAEIHYIPDNVAELRWFLEAPGLAESPWLKWSFNAGHANLVPEHVAGFLDAFGVERIAQVRLTDNRGDFEEHLVPGQGTVDFADLFFRLDQLGYTGPFSLDFGAAEDKVRVRDAWLGV
jgi:sugar phosphate isomerase/epimerase